LLFWQPLPPFQQQQLPKREQFNKKPMSISKNQIKLTNTNNRSISPENV